jgi:tetratricopeptide (TPR) repeat protein
MSFSKRAYVKQLSLYLQNKEYEKSYPLAKEMYEEFPGDPMSHYFLAAAAYWNKHYEEAIEHGRKAFNLVNSNEDMIACALVTSSAYYVLGRYPEALRMLRAVEELQPTAGIEKMMFVISLAMGDKDEAMGHVTKLYSMNRKMAVELLKKFL